MERSISSIRNRVPCYTPPLSHRFKSCNCHHQRTREAEDQIRKALASGPPLYLPIFEQRPNMSLLFRVNEDRSFCINKVVRNPLLEYRAQPFTTRVVAVEVRRRPSTALLPVL